MTQPRRSYGGLLIPCLLAACQVEPARLEQVPTAVLLDVILPTPTPTATSTMTTTPTLTATITPTVVPTLAPLLVCTDLLNRLATLSFPEGAIASGLDGPPKGVLANSMGVLAGESKVLCWWEVYWAEDIAADGTIPDPPEWSDTASLLAAVAPTEAELNHRPWIACGAGASYSGLRVDRGDMVCTHISGHGSPNLPDDVVTFRSRQIVCSASLPEPAGGRGP